MRETIQNYFEKTKQYPNYYSNEDFSTICDGIKKEIDKGVFLVERKDETDLSVFEEKYGYTLPTEINDYICFGILVLEDIVILKNLLYYSPF
jgi:hypothetical protein